MRYQILEFVDSVQTHKLKDLENKNLEIKKLIHF